MKHKKLKMSTLFLLLGFGALHAQEAATASGGDASGSGGSVAYSVGQVFYTTNTGTSGSVAHGVQQHFEISSVTGLDEMGINLNFFAYPNPTRDLLILEVENSKGQSFSYHLYDMQGKLLENKKIVESSSPINMESLSSSTYFLKVTDNQTIVKTFRIIKN